MSNLENPNSSNPLSNTSDTNNTSNPRRLRLCCVPNCKSYRRCHRIPCQENKRGRYEIQRWMQIIKNPDINRTNYHWFCICEKHFKPDQISRTGRLFYNALPSMYLSGSVSPEPDPNETKAKTRDVKVQTCSDLTINVDKLSTTDLDKLIAYSTENNAQLLQCKIKRLTGRLTKLQKEFKEFKKMHKPTPENILRDLELHLQGNALLFCRMQLSHATKYSPWLPEEKRLALSIYHRSSVTYTFLREHLKLVLPSLGSLKRRPADSVSQRSIIDQNAIMEQCEILTEWLKTEPRT